MKLFNRTLDLYLLVLIVAFEAIGALYGGWGLIVDPTGKKIKLPPGMIENSMFQDYLIPGIILFTFLGVIPLFLAYSLLFKPKWRLIGFLNIYPGYHWAWTYTMYTAIILISWINIQVIILNFGSMIQGAFGLLGVTILILTLIPRVKRQYRLANHYKKHDTVKK
jgi:hypothetical protein